MFFVRGVAETVKKLRWNPQLIHCSGWITALAPMYMRKMYAEEPAFAGAKIVYSVFDDGFEGALDARMAEKLRMDGFTDDDLRGLAGNPIDCLALNKIAVDYADAVVQSSPEMNPELLAYIKASGKPFLPFPGKDEYVTAVADFYASL